MPEPEDSSEFGPAVGPDEAELPDESPDLDEIEPFEADTGEFEDINEFVSAEWRESTTARERVKDIIYRTATPMTAAGVADLAEVSEPTARTKLSSLADEGTVIAESSANGTVYQRDPDWYRLNRVRQLADKPPEAIESVLRRIEKEISGYKEEYEVESPEDVILEHESVGEEAWKDVSEWRTAIVDKQYIKTALQFRRLRSSDVNSFDPRTHSEDPDHEGRNVSRP